MQESQQKVCQICFTEPSKYKCPACSTATCSLPCIKLHKAQSQCSGIVDTTKYIARTDFEKDGEGERMIQRDYNFLNGLGRELQVRKDDVKLKNKRILQTSGGFNHNKKRQNRGQVSEDEFFKQTTMIKRGVNVKILPKGMSRNMQNKSHFDKKLSEYVWTLEMILVDADTGHVLKTGINWKCSECTKVKETLSDKIKTILELPEYKKMETITQNDTENVENSEKTLQNKFVKETEEYHFFLKMIDRPQNKPELKYLDPEKQLGEVLKNQWIIEFPTLIISTKRKILGIWKEVEEKKVSEEESSSSSSSDDDSSDDDSDSDSDNESSSEDDCTNDEDDAPEELSSAKPLTKELKDENTAIKSEVVFLN